MTTIPTDAHFRYDSPDLHEDIFDELTRQPMQVVGHEVHPAMAPVLFPSFAASEAMEEMLDAAEIDRRLAAGEEE